MVETLLGEACGAPSQVGYELRHSLVRESAGGTAIGEGSDHLTFASVDRYGDGRQADLPLVIADAVTVGGGVGDLLLEIGEMRQSAGCSMDDPFQEVTWSVTEEHLRQIGRASCRERG